MTGIILCGIGLVACFASIYLWRKGEIEAWTAAPDKIERPPYPRQTTAEVIDIQPFLRARLRKQTEGGIER